MEKSENKKIPISMTIEEELALKIREIARMNRRTFSGEITVLLESALMEREREKSTE